MRAKRLRPFLALVLLASVAAACGGGGGGLTGSVAVLDDTYFMIGVGAADASPDDQGQSLWSLLTLDGLGGVTGTFGGNFAGAVNPMVPIPAPSTYAVDPDYSTSFFFGGANGYSGWTEAGGGLVLLGNTTVSDDPAILALARLGTGYGNGSLNGVYVLCGWSVTTDGSADALIGEISFDGMGGGSLAFTENLEGGIGGPYGPFAMTYNVASNGQVTFGMLGFTIEGVVTRSGELVLAAGSTVSTDPPIVFAMLKPATSGSNGLFAGSYQLAGIERDGGGFSSQTGAAYAAGSGLGSTTVTHNTDGSVFVSGPENFDYEVQVNGTLAIDPIGGMGPVGAISADGSVAILGGPTAGGSSPGLYLLFRR